MRRNRKQNFGQEVKAMAKVMTGKDIFPEIKMPRKQRSDKGKSRHGYNREEDEIRNGIIKTGRKKGIKVYRIENAICGKHNTGIPDLWFFNEKKGFAGWIEVKSSRGELTGTQPEFQFSCKVCEVNHWVCNSVSQAMEVML